VRGKSNARGSLVAEYQIEKVRGKEEPYKSRTQIEADVVDVVLIF